jgi:hypothetical protein
MITWWCPIAGPIASSTPQRYPSSQPTPMPGVSPTRFVTSRNLIPHLDIGSLSSCAATVSRSRLTVAAPAAMIVFLLRIFRR